MIDPEVPTLLARADAMAAAANRLRPSPGEDPAAYLLLRSLATELTLKGLLAASKGRYPRLHSLRALFGDLPDEERERVERLHRRLFRDHHPESDGAEADAVLAHIADAAGDAFQMARYPLVRDMGGVPDPEPLRLVARARLLELLG